MAAVREQMNANVHSVGENLTVALAAGANTSRTTVPADKVWILQAISISNPDASARTIDFGVATNGDVRVATIASGSVAAADTLRWQGRVVLAPGQKLEATYAAMTGSNNSQIRYLVMEVPASASWLAKIV